MVSVFLFELNKKIEGKNRNEIRTIESVTYLNENEINVRVRAIIKILQRHLVAKSNIISFVAPSCSK